MKLAILFALATIASAEQADTTSLRIFREDATYAQQIAHEGAQLDSVAHDRRVQAQAVYAAAQQRFARVNHLGPTDSLRADGWVVRAPSEPVRDTAKRK